MQQDNHNIQIDQQLRELEQYSLPDLSRQDDHWKSMAGMLITVPTAQPAKGFSKTWKWITGVGVVTIIVITTFFILQKSGGEHSFEGGNKETQPVTQTTLPGKDSASGTYGADTLAVSDTTKGFAIERGRTSPASSDAVLNDLYDRLEKKFQYFNIDNGRDTVLYGNEGTILTIPAYTFDTELVTIMLQEFYTVKDMVGNLLYTKTTKGEQLITGGMFYIEAVRQGRENENANIRTGYSIRLDIPKTTDKTMNLFYGEVSDGNEMPDITWNLTDWKFTSTSNQMGKEQKPAIGDIEITTNKQGSRARTSNPAIVTEGMRNDPLANLLRDTPTKRSATVLSPNVTIATGRRDSIAGNVTVRNNILQFRSDTVVIRNDSVLTLTSDFTDQLNDRYGVNLRSLGWINCDRFWNEPGPKVDFYVQLDKPAATAYTYLVFDRYQSILPASGLDNNQTIAFRNVPANEKVTVICVGAENGKLLTVTKATVTSTSVLKLAYEENTAAGFSRSLAGRTTPNMK